VHQYDHYKHCTDNQVGYQILAYNIGTGYGQYYKMYISNQNSTIFLMIMVTKLAVCSESLLEYLNYKCL